MNLGHTNYIIKVTNKTNLNFIFNIPMTQNYTSNLRDKYKSSLLSTSTLKEEFKALHSQNLIPDYVKPPLGPMNVEEFICYIEDIRKESLQENEGFIPNTLKIHEDFSKSFYSIDQNATISDLRERTNRIIYNNGANKNQIDDKSLILNDVLRKFVEYEKEKIMVEGNFRKGRYGMIYAMVMFMMFVIILIVVVLVISLEENPY